jgi:magnesium transporter
MIVAFQSLILGMAGNVGTQSLAVTVRAIGNSEDNSFKKQFVTILKEVRVALLNGIVLGAISFAIVSVYLFVFASYGAGFVFAAAVCVGLAMCFAMAISGFTGAAIPICLYRCGIDPAVASGPLITTINDLVAVISYYGLAWVLLLNL